jgi:hypothetical protein
MTGKGSRAKGASAERELFALLSDNLGVVVKRNLSQTRGGGADTLDIPGWAIEVKRVEKLNITAWWQQAQDQAGTNRRPILFYRASRQPWKAVVRLEDINSQYAGFETVVLSLNAACMVIRESLYL